MHLDIPPENTIQKDLASHNLTVPKASFHEILELYDIVSQHDYKNYLSDDILNQKFPVLSTKCLKDGTLKCIIRFEFN